MSRLYNDKILCGDSLAELQKMPDGFIDLGITSPPYNKQEKNNGELVSKVVYSSFRDSVPEAEYQENQVRVLDELFRVIKEGGSFFYNHKIRWVNGEMFHPMDWLRKTQWTVKQEIIWDRTIAGNIRGWRFWQVEERIYWLYKPMEGNKKGKELDSKDAKLTSIWRNVPENNNPHPAPFPVWLPARIILSLLSEQEAGLVIDPYIGSGTTAVAAALLGHTYIGIDIDEQYIDYAQERIKNRAQECDKVEKERALHIVKKSHSKRKQEAKSALRLFA
ncbi:MAG: site-specific DNA-methyltransferase [Candidatus Spechtbacteria bacterium SB0662_bin_43]|uniref:Methyltransferase n=1 Tax=Candidatus Spechtbacteria bacterium SB0662_bin_43 TaxID=2604897 RepID=A0A845DEW0_9BACT|nr:site-specific DNA-methyltransferase [Candidatus Spechtbacteria bacterium SB0662_bin_43]